MQKWQGFCLQRSSECPNSGAPNLAVVHQADNCIAGETRSPGEPFQAENVKIPRFPRKATTHYPLQNFRQVAFEHCLHYALREHRQSALTIIAAQPTVPLAREAQQQFTVLFYYGAGP